MTKDISILDLLALLEVFNEYNEFESDLNKLLEHKKIIETLAKIRELANGEKVLCSRKIKFFYKKHEQIIKKIHNIVNIQSFIYHSSDWSKKTNIYKYLDAHRNELNKIKEIVLKLKDLGIDKIEFDENFNFSAKKYYIYNNSASNTSIHFLSDIEVIPEYPDGKIIYQSMLSPFEIKFHTSFGILSDRYNKAKLNSLTFDKNLLPNEISNEAIIKPIYEAKEERENEYKAIENIVDLRQTQSLLMERFNRLEEILQNIDELKEKENIKNALKEIKKQIEKIKDEIALYEEQIIYESTYITPEFLDSEEEAYERRKRDSALHIW